MKFLYKTFFIIFYNVFYPWVNCISDWATYEYMMSSTFERKVKAFGYDKTFDMFLNNPQMLEEYFDIAIDKHGLRILFMPWRTPLGL